MTFLTIQSKSIITALDHHSLREFWRGLQRRHRPLVARIRVMKPLTDSQLRRLPRELRQKMA